MHARGAEVHQRKGDGSSGAACADENGRLAIDARAQKPFLEAALKTAAVGVVAGGVSVCGDRYGVHRTDLLRLSRHLIQQRNNRLFARESDVDAVESRSFY